MAYKCLDCGHIFEEGEQKRWEEKHGLDNPPYEEFTGCPLCKGEYEETTSCVVCKGLFLKEELADGICKECIEELQSSYRYNPKKCYEVSKGETEKIEINYFLSTMFSEKEIEELLYRELLVASEIVPVDCTPFIENDVQWFNEMLVEEVKK